MVQEARERKFPQGTELSPRSFGASGVSQGAAWASLQEAGRRGESQGGSCCKAEQADGPLEQGVGWGELSQLQQSPHLPASTPWSRKKGRNPDAKSCLHRSHPGGFYQIQKESRRPTSYQRPPPDRCHHFPARDSFRLMQGLATHSCPLPPPPWLNNLGTILSSN